MPLPEVRCHHLEFQHTDEFGQPTLIVKVKGGSGSYNLADLPQAARRLQISKIEIHNLYHKLSETEPDHELYESKVIDSNNELPKDLREPHLSADV